MRPFSVAESFVAYVTVAMRVVLVIVVVAAVDGNLISKLYEKVSKDFLQWTHEFPAFTKVSSGCSWKVGKGCHL